MTSKTQRLYDINAYVLLEKRLHTVKSSALTQCPREDHKKSTSLQSSFGEVTMHSSTKSIYSKEKPSSRADRDCLASENERVSTNALASSPGLDSASSGYGRDKGEMSETSTDSNTKSRMPYEQADRRNAVNTPNLNKLGKGASGVERSSGSRISNKISTGPTVTYSYVPKNREDRQPPATPTMATPSTRQGRGPRQAGKIWHWTLVTCLGSILGLIVIVALAHAIGCESPLAGAQKSCDLVLQAEVGITSAYMWMIHATQQLNQRLPALTIAPRYSSAEQLGVRLSQTHTNLSQALAASDLLFRVPALISKKRAEALRFRLPEGSLTSEPLRLFLQQSVHVDENLLRLILSLGQIATLALRQQQLTVDTVRSIQLAHYFGTLERLRIYVVGFSTQEAQPRRRLEEHSRFLDEKITIADEAARKALQEYIMLSSTTEAIRESSRLDQQRLLALKEQTASQFNWLTRATIQILGLSEPEDLARSSQNVELAEGIHGWAQNVTDGLQRVISRLVYTKANIGSLIEIMSTNGTVTWDVVDKDRGLKEFLAQISDGVEILNYNTAAWIQLQVAGLI